MDENTETDGQNGQLEDGIAGVRQLLSAPVEDPVRLPDPTKPPRRPARTPRTGRPAGVRDVTPRQAANYPRPMGASGPYPGPIPQPTAVHPSALTTKPIPAPKHQRLQPQDFFEYWKLVEAVTPSRATVYVYRIWPVIDRQRAGLPNNIDKLTVDDSTKFDHDNWKDEFLRKYGSGDYKVMLNAFNPLTGRDSNYCTARIEKLRDPDYPPVIDYNHLVLNDKDNESYIERLKQQQILTLDGKPAGATATPQPTAQQTEDEAQMSTVVETSMGMIERSATQAQARADQLSDENARLRSEMEKLRTQQSSAPVSASDPAAAAAKVVDVFIDTVKRGQQMTSEMQAGAAASMAKMQDPFALMAEVAKLAEMFKGGAGAGGDPMVGQLMTMLITQGQAHQQAMAEANTRMMEIVMRKSEPAPQKTLLETAQEIKAVKDIVDDGGGRTMDMGQGDDGEFRPRRNQHWSEILIPMLAPLVAPLLQRVMGGGQPQPQQPQYAIPPGYQLAPGQYQQPSYQQQPQPGMQPQQQQPQAPQMPSTTGGYEQLHQLLAHFQGPILQAINNGQTGFDFADWVCQGYGNVQFLQFKAVGFQALWTAITTYPPLWSQIGPMEVQFQAWLQDVLAYDPNQQDDGDGMEPDEAIPGPGPTPVTIPRGVPTSAKPAGSYASPAVSTMMGQ